MNWKSHVIIGCLLTLAIFLFLFNIRDYATLIVLTIFGGLSALLPDLDHDLSKGRKILNVFVILGSILFFVFFSNSYSLQNSLTYPLAVVGIYFILFAFFKPRHRGVTHSIVFAVSYGIILFFLAGIDFAVAGFIGYFSHLLADGMIKII
ncbi:MAG: metal-dependent hydrolase [Candidatus Micrarchaeota archaeon]